MTGGTHQTRSPSDPARLNEDTRADEIVRLRAVLENARDELDDAGSGATA